jgi:hypothetical protein
VIQVCMDIYTNSATQYYGVYLFFPSVFMHMEFEDSEDHNNDGILEVRASLLSSGTTRLNSCPYPTLIRAG